MSYSPENDGYYTKAAWEMERIGGHFAAAIARAYYAADSGNRALLIDAFGHLFDKHAPTDLTN